MIIKSNLIISKVRIEIKHGCSQKKAHPNPIQAKPPAIALVNMGPICFSAGIIPVLASATMHARKPLFLEAAMHHTYVSECDYTK